MSRPLISTQVLYIPRGGVGEIISYLSKQDLNLSAIDKWSLVFIGKPQTGWVDLGSIRISHGDFLYKISTSKAALKKITLIPGETRVVFLSQLSKQLGLNEVKLNEYYEKMAPFLDGYLVPETYSVPIGINEEKLILHLVSVAESYHLKLSKKVWGSYDKKRWEQILIIASIIQKEAANESEMPIVASVIYNRLKRGIKLQMDGTLNYGKYSHEKITANRIRSDISRYNTYVYAGLPPAPICAVSTQAIRAALSPSNTPYLYFVLDRNTKTHKFSSTLQEHNKNINTKK